MNKQQGFSAIELLITLFIGALFLFAGYQLYSYVTRSGFEAARQSAASSIAYTYLRQNENTPPSTCTVSNLNSVMGCTSTYPFPANYVYQGISNITITVSQREYLSAAPNVLQTVVTISYFDTYSQKTLTHGTYAVYNEPQ